MTKRDLVFDLDGTLSNPALGIARSMNYALAAFGLPAAQEYLSSPDSELWALCSDRSAPVGFIGLADNNVEALFVRFYEANGFHVIGRLPVDDGGRPFPLLRLWEVVS